MRRPPSRGNPASLLCVLCALLFASSAPAANLTLFEIEGANSHAYLLGSIHALPENFYPLPATIESAYEASDTLVLEVDLSRVTDAETIDITRELGYYTDGRVVSDVVSARTLELLQAYSARRGIPMTIQPMKPWLVGTTIGILELQRLGYEPDNGLDQYYMRRAVEEGKPIRQLETMREQLEVMAADPIEIQDVALRSSLEELDLLDEQIEDLMKAWHEGDIETMYAIAMASLGEYPELESQYLRVIDDRNLTMADSIHELLGVPGKRYLIVVGALHLGGGQGLVKLLREDYRVTQKAVP